MPLEIHFDTTLSFFDIGYHGILTMYKDEIKDTMEDIMIRNNLFDGCGISRYWQPASVLVMGSYNVTVTNNGGFPEVTILNFDQGLKSYS